MKATKLFYPLMILAHVFCIAEGALAVTAPSITQSPEDAGFIEPKSSERAFADVQIRRIKNLISTQKIDPEVAFERWERLQDKLEGRR